MGVKELGCYLVLAAKDMAVNGKGT
jgi:hypothetical protein